MSKIFSTRGDNLPTQDPRLTHNDTTMSEQQQHEQPSSSSYMDEQLKVWRKEQDRITSQVIVKEDPCSYAFETNRFKCKSLNDDDANKSGRPLCLYGGVDVSFPPAEEIEGGPSLAIAVYVVLNSENGSTVYHDHEYFHLSVPYVSSYLAFREVDPLLRLIQRQGSQSPQLTPRVILVDGNGIFHARRAGIATFLGVLTGIPAVGVAKTLYAMEGLTKELVKDGMDKSLQALVKEISQNSELQDILKKQNGNVLLIDQQCIEGKSVSSDEEQQRVSSSTVVMEREACIRRLSDYCQGVAVKLRGCNGQVFAAALVGHGGGPLGRGSRGQSQGAGTRVPIYISVGHNVSLEEAVEICTRLSLARIPEPVRQADLSGRELLRTRSKG